jgi:hypothetical protein
MVVVVREGTVDVSDIEVVIGGDPFGRFAGVDDLPGDVVDADPSALDAGRTAEDVRRRDDFGQTNSWSRSRSNLWWSLRSHGGMGAGHVRPARFSEARRGPARSPRFRLSRRLSDGDV